jgi:hypothetical protein
MRRRLRRALPASEPVRVPARVRELGAREIRLERALRLARRTIAMQRDADGACLQVIDNALDERE